MQHGIHQGQTVGIMDQLAAGEGFFLLELGLIGAQVIEIVSMLFDILMGGDHKTKGAAGRVIAPLPRLGLHQPGHHINQDTRGKILARAGFFLVCVLFQKALVQVAQSLFPCGVPVQAVDGGDDLF